MAVLCIPELIRSMFTGKTTTTLAERIRRDFRTNVNTKAGLMLLQLGVWFLCHVQREGALSGEDSEQDTDFSALNRFLKDPSLPW